MQAYDRITYSDKQKCQKAETVPGMPNNYGDNAVNIHFISDKQTQ